MEEKLQYGGTAGKYYDATIGGLDTTRYFNTHNFPNIQPKTSI